MMRGSVPEGSISLIVKCFQFILLADVFEIPQQKSMLHDDISELRAGKFS